MNKVILSGNLCRDNELKKTTTGKEVVSNCVAVQRDYKNNEGKYESDFINFIAWGNSATYLSKYSAKGDRVEIVGSWQVRKYEDKNGLTQTFNEVVVESVSAFSRKQKDKDPEEKNPNASFADLTAVDGDFPF